MKNIAIVLGVSAYQRMGNLPGSKNDASQIHEILKLTAKFDDILYLNEDKFSSDVKEEIIGFAERYKGNKIDELLLYFSGHGEYFNNEFYYLLTDFSEQKRNQTSIQNTFLDDLIRSLKPTTTIKIIDACQSGTQYIKDSNTINKYFKGTQEQFNKCYFLFSSQQDQSSFQTKYISDFTNSFINALKKHSNTDIRYRNIVDYISDEFISNTEQKPFFVIQAENTEKFCSINNDLKNYLEQYDGLKSQYKSAADNKRKKSTYEEIITQDAEQYCTEEEVVEIINSFKETVNSFTLNTEIKSLFKIDIKFTSEYINISDIQPVVNWLNKNEGQYFINILYKDKYVEEPVYGSFSGLTGYSNLGISPRLQQTETKTIKVPTSFKFTYDVPYVCVSIDIVPELTNLITYNAGLVFVTSKKNIRFFYYLSTYTEQSWVSKTLNENKEWRTEEFLLKNTTAISLFFKSFNESINSYILKDLREKFNINEENPLGTTFSEAESKAPQPKKAIAKKVVPKKT